MVLEAVSRLWSMSLQAGMLIIVVLAVRLLLKKYPKVYVYFLWMLVGVRLLCPVFVETPFSLQPETILPDEITQNGKFFSRQESYFRRQLTDNQEIQTNSTGKENISSGGSEDTGAGTGIGENGTIPLFLEKDVNLNNMENPDTPDQRETHDKSIITDFLNKVPGLLVVVYLVGAGVFFCFYLIQYIVIKCRVSTAVRGKMNVWFSEKIDSPFVLGIIRPRILMPYGLKKQEGYQILKHEQTHIRHHDPLIRLVGTLCICLHWWNPLVWLAVFKMNQDMEMYCDETVLRDASAEERKSYARTLLSFAEKRSGLSVGLAFGESHTERRVRNLQRKRKGGILITVLVIILAVFCVVAFMTIPGMSSERADSGTDNAGTDNAGADNTGADNTGADNAGADHTDSNDTGSNGQSVPGIGNGSVSLTEEDKKYLMDICPKIPVFSSEEEMNADFWRKFLFNYYTSDFERESVDRYMDPPGFEIPYAKIGYDEVQNTVEQIFGKPLWTYVENPQDLVQENSILFDDDIFYISLSDSPDYKYEYVSDKDTDIMKEVELLEGINGDEDYHSQIYLYLLPSDNERGFIISGKDMMHVPQNTQEGMIEGATFDVEMNPHGQVTFAAYAPDTAMSPYEDVAFKLIQNEQVIYSFGGAGIRHDKAWVFQNVAAVSFPDLNNDGYTDVITIVNYKYNDSILSEARIYTGREGRYFIEELTLEEEYNNTHDQKTISDIEDFVVQPEYQDYFERTSIYGRWKVTEAISSSGIHALSEEEIKSFENTQLQYGRYWYKQGSEDSCTVDHYRKESITAEQFEEDFKINTEIMGLTAASFDYFELEGVSDSASLFGQFFYQIDKDNALIYYEGVFFRAVRE